MFNIYKLLKEDSSSNYNKNNINLFMEADDDEDFNIDTTLDDDDSTDDQDNGDQSQSNENEDQATSDDAGGDDSQTDEAQDDQQDAGGDEGQASDQSDEGEVNVVNTNIFASLTAEEQAAKIKELQNLYHNLYNSCDEINDRLSKLRVDDTQISVINRTSEILNGIKSYIADYLKNFFGNKSYLENDIKYNEIFSLISTVRDVLDDVAKNKEKKDAEEQKKNEKHTGLEYFV